MKLPDAEEIRREFRRIHVQRSDISVARLITRLVFEPPNIFAPDARPRPKLEILIILSYVLLIAGAWAAFNLG
jgi:hypothetical protein